MSTIIKGHHSNSRDPDQTLHFAASDLGLHCLPMSHKKDAGHIWVKTIFTFPLYNQHSELLAILDAKHCAVM